MIIVTNNLDLICVASDKTPIHFVTNDVNKVNMLHYIWTIDYEAAVKEIVQFFTENGDTKDDYLRVRKEYNDDFGQDPIAFYYLWQLSFYKRTRYSLKGEYNAGFGHNDNYLIEPEHIRMIVNAVENSAFFLLGNENFFENHRMNDTFIIWFGDDEYIYKFALENEIPTLCIKDTKVNASAEVLWKINCDDGVEYEMCDLFNNCRQEWQ